MWSVWNSDVRVCVSCMRLIWNRGRTPVSQNLIISAYLLLSSFLLLFVLFYFILWHVFLIVIFNSIMHVSQDLVKSQVFTTYTTYFYQFCLEWRKKYSSTKMLMSIKYLLKKKPLQKLATHKTVLSFNDIDKNYVVN